MAANRKSGAGSGASEEYPGETLGDPDAAGEVSAEDKLAEFFGSSPESARYSVYEVDPDEPKKPSFLFKFSADEALEPDEILSDLLSTYGPGEYEIVARDPESGRLKLRQRFRVGSRRHRGARRIVPEPAGAERSQQNNSAPAQQPPPQSSVSPDVMALLEHQQKMFEQMLERMASMQQSQPQQQPADTLDMIERLERMRQTFQPKEKTESLAEQINTLLEIRDKLSSETGEKSPLDSAVKTLAPAIERVLDRFGGSGGTITNPAAAGHDQQTGAEDSPMHAMLSRLRTLAEQQTATEQAAEQVCQVLAQQPAWLEQTVLNMVIEGPENAAAELVKFDPSLAQYQSWLIEVAQHIERAVYAAEEASAEAVQDAAKSGTAEKASADAGGDS